jgi:hypothetical protein
VAGRGRAGQQLVTQQIVAATIAELDRARWQVAGVGPRDYKK